MLVKLDREYTAQKSADAWERYYAREIIEHFRPGA
jgi:hypothetical protein